ncbi:MAG: A/G-specific adenine glycosylase [Alistipes sp.]|nr:A/G-specific adenine glycosylase [Alistipes sp.]
MSDYRLEEIVEPLLKWYKENARILPWRENTDPYRIWISEIMLQQTRVEAVIAYYNRFLRELPTIRDLAACDDERLMKLWEGLGYYSRARNLKKAAQVICAEHQGRFPAEFDAVVKLPGIGTYTAGAVCSIAFERKTAAVDGNVLRVLTRLTLDPADIMNNKFREEMKRRLEAVYPEGQCGNFTQSLMELGATVCVPNGAPKCMECPLGTLCLAYRENRQTEFPVRKKKAERKIVRKTVFLLCRKEYIAIKRREEDGLLGGMWEFPNVDGELTKKGVKEWLAKQGVTGIEIGEPFEKKHVFSHVEWHMKCFVVKCGSVGEENGITWITRERLEGEVALPTAFRKVYEGNKV